MRALLLLLVRLFPAEFGAQFGADMREQIRGDYERARGRGFVSVVGFTAATALDLVRSALAERWNPTWVDTAAVASQGERMGWVEGWVRDLRHAVRSLGRSPGFAAVAVGTLGLAIGVNAGIFSVVDTVLLKPLPYDDTDRLLFIAASAPGSDLPAEFGVSQEFYLQYGDSPLLEDAALFATFTATLRADDRTERVWMSVSTTSLLHTLGAAPLLGRLPAEEDEDRVVVLSHALWTTWFGRDPAVLGRTFEVAGAPRTVIGVMGPEFWFPNNDILLWFPYIVREEGLRLGSFGQGMVARAAPEVRREALVEELTRLARQIPDRFGASASYARMLEQHRPIVRPLEEQILGRVSRPLWVLLGSVLIVLLIACGNVANLFAVRGEGRRRDVAVRRAIGAARGELIRSQLAESIVVAALAAPLAVLLAWVSVPAFLRAAPPEIPRLAEVGLTVPTVLFAFTVAVLSALACGLGPALRDSSPDLTRLRDGGRGSTRRRHWGRDGLVVAQTALALVLLIGSALLVRSFWSLRNVDPGYDTEDLFTFQIAPESADLRDGPAYARFHLAFMERLAALPGVERVGIVENVPLNEGTASTRVRTEEMSDAEGGGTLLNYTFSAGAYYEAMGIDVLRGRPFATADHVSEHNNVILSESAAELLWPGQDAIGKRLLRQGMQEWQTVVGVVEDVLQYGFRDTPQPLIYFPLVGPTPTSWVLSSPAYVLKTRRAAVIAPEVRALVREVAPNAPMYRVYTMAGLAADSMVQLSFTMLALGIASLLALILGAVGLYGVLSYVVAERTQEIGVRMALGAEAGRVRRMVVAQGARVVLLGAFIGAWVALGTTRALGGLLFGVQAVDAATFLAMSTTMVFIGLLASYMPARRASSVDPIRSLRGE